jgi:multidrug efflux pump subunit AcrA (membrane-fusion protein)
METEVDLPNPDGVIKAGMFGYATLVLERRQDVLTVPIEALGSRSEPITVLVVGSDRRLQERQVKTGMETPDRVEVVSGLDEGDAVVIGARSNLRVGLMVEPQVSTATHDARAH